MKKDLITEINRLNELIGGKTLLTEQPIPKILKWFFKTQSDDAVERIVRKGVNNSDEFTEWMRMINDGEELSKEIAEKLLKNTDTMRLLANTLLDGTILGTEFYKSIDKLVKKILEDPNLYDEYIEKFSINLDIASIQSEWPDGLADEMMEFIKKKVDDVKPIRNVDVKPITNVGGEAMSSGEKIFKNSIDNDWAKQIANWTDEEAEILSKYLSSKQGWITFKNKISVLFSSSKTLQDDLLLNLRKWKNASFTQKQQLEKIMADQFNQLKSRQGMAIDNVKKWVEDNMSGKGVDVKVKNLGEKLLKESETNSFSFIRLLFGKGPKSTITTIFSDLLKGNSNFVRIAFKYGTPPGWIWSIGKLVVKGFSKNSAELFAKSGLKRRSELNKIGSWFATGNPNLFDDMVLASKNEGDKINFPKEMWKSTKNKFANMGIIGSGAYIAASAYYRYWVVSLYYGLTTWVSNLSIEFTDGLMDADLTQNKFLEKIFGYKSFIDRKVARGLVNDSIIENSKIVWDEINLNSEPWRQYFGVIPSLEIFSGLATVIFKSNNNVLINDVEQFIVKAEEETEKAKEKVDDITDRYTYNLITKKFNLIK